MLTRISIHRQAIMPGYKFVCDDTTCGNITEWGVDVYPARGQNQMAYSLDFQVWRPSPTVDDSTGTGCYSLVGNNRFTSISLSGGVARVTPSPQDYIQFQRGDVLGFYVEGVRDFGDGVVLTTSGDNSGARSTVWFASIAPSMATSQTGGCPYSVGSNGVLNSSIRGIAPVISIKTGTIGIFPTNIELDILSITFLSFVLIQKLIHVLQQQWLQPSLLPWNPPLPPLLQEQLATTTTLIS